MSKACFIGTWRLVSTEFRRADGRIDYPFGKNAVGQLYYDAAGNMAVQFMRADRPAFASGDLQNGTSAEIKAAFAGVVTYFGTYEIDEQVATVIHHVTACTFPNWNGWDQVRFFAFSHNQLILSTPPFLAGGSTTVGVLTWERIG